MTVSDVLKKIDTAPYILLFEIHGSEVYIDPGNRVLKVMWYWNVNKETISKMLDFIFEKISDGSANKVLLDRRKLNKFESNAFDWIKNDIFKKKRKSTIDLIERVAIVEEETLSSKLFGSIISLGIQVIYANVPIKKFEQINEAESWLHD